MTEKKDDQPTQHDAHWESLPDIITLLADLQPGTMISLQGLAEKLGRHPKSIKGCVNRKELPTPISLGNKEYWTVGFLLDYMEQRLRVNLQTVHASKRHTNRAGVHHVFTDRAHPRR